MNDRTIDVLEMGRHHPKLHPVLVHLYESGKLVNFVSSKIDVHGNISCLIFNTTTDLANALTDSKILICFPRCDINPQRAGNIETLTQRYWEGMLSGCVMVGRAPIELIQMIGYNPVVEIDLENSDKQILDIVNNIELYQDLVDKNYVSAQKHASWDNRMVLLKEYLKKEQYVFC